MSRPNSSVAITSVALIQNGLCRPKVSNAKPSKIGKPTRVMPPYVCCTPMYNPRSELATTRDSMAVTHGKVKAVPSGSRPTASASVT